MSDTREVTRRDFLRGLSLAGLVGLGPVLSACGGSSGDGGGAATASASDASGASQSPAGGADGSVAKTVTLHPKGNQMKYRETEFTVPAGQKVKVVFDNTATSPSMQHNVVVLNESPTQSHFQKVGQAGMAAGSSQDYVPQEAPTVLAHTPIAKPGETVSVTFETPSEPGDYGYVCTFPGHWATMQGTMHVTG